MKHRNSKLLGDAWPWVVLLAILLAVPIVVGACTPTPESGQEPDPGPTATATPSATPMAAAQLRLGANGRLEGRVSNALGTPVSADIVLLTTDGTTVRRVPGSGNYFMSNQAAGSYIVKAEPTPGSGCQSEYFEDASDIADATVLEIDGDDPPAKADFVLCEPEGVDPVQISASSNCAVIHDVVDQVAICFIDPDTPTATPANHTPDPDNPGLMAAGACMVTLDITIPACAGGGQVHGVTVTIGSASLPATPAAAPDAYTVDIKASDVSTIGHHPLDVTWTCEETTSGQLTQHSRTTGVLGGCDPGGYVRADGIALPGTTVELHFDPAVTPESNTASSVCSLAGFLAQKPPNTGQAVYWNDWSGEQTANPSLTAHLANPTQIGEQLPVVTPRPTDGAYGWVAIKGCYYVDVNSPLGAHRSPMIGVDAAVPPLPDNVKLDLRSKLDE